MIFVIGVTSSFVIGLYLLRTHFKEFNKAIFVSTIVSILVGVLIEIYIEFVHVDDDWKHIDDEHIAGVPVVLWWTPFSRKRDEIRQCADVRCFFTENRSLRNAIEPKVFVFYGSDLNFTDLPVPRGQELWALFHEESIKNFPGLLSEHFFSLFNFTSTFNRNSNLPLTTLHLNNLDELTDTKFFVPTATKNEFLDTIAPVVYIQSSCDTLIDRDDYVRDLSKYLKIDSFGRCLNNATLPKHLQSISSLSSDEFLSFLARYKFIIAVENAVCDDYITEKLWRALSVGVVPLYFGSPSVRDWLPSNRSTVLIADFDTPQSLAKFLIELNNRDDLYDQLLMHKTAAKVDNNLLKATMKTRSWAGYESLVENFECEVCLFLHDPHRLKKTPRSHFDCDTPKSMLTKEKNENNYWNEILAVERCKGRATYDFISKNLTYTAQTLEEKVRSFIGYDEC